MNIPTSSYVTWTEQGIDLSTAAVSSLPIEDGSICWGAWIEAGSDPKLKDPTLPERVRAKLSPNQLVITPLPPDTWPISFCLQLELSDDANSLAFATRVIHALGLNIVSARTAPSGFSHTTWTVVCEAPELRRKAFHHTRSLRHSLSNSRVDLLGTAAFWPPGPGVKIELTEEQVSKIETASDSEPFPIALDSRQISKIEKEFPTRTVKDKSVSISKEQKDQIVEIRKHDSSNGTKLFELSAQQSVDLFLLRRAKKLDHKPQEEIWRDFAFVLAERLLIRMHEALWCLRLISHFQEAISIGVKEETGRILDRVNSVVTGWMGKDEANKRNLAAMVRALKFVLDNVGSDDMSKRFDKDRGPDTPFAVALHSVSEACGFKDDAVLRSSFTKENRHGFLHFRFLYGLDEFLVKKSDLSDVFTEYVGDFREDSPLDDKAAKGGQSLQRILNGIKHDGEVESLGLYKDMIGDLIDRSNELDAHVLRLKPEERENFKLHQRLKFLLSIDAKRRTSKAADGRLLSHLIYLWIKIRGDLVRVREFKYNRERQLLEAPGKSLSNSIPNGLQLNLPLKSMISVNPLQCVAKLFPITSEHNERIMRARVCYEIRFEKASREDKTPRSSAGILDTVTSAIMSTNASIVSYSNQIRDRPRHLDSTQRPRDRGIINVDMLMPDKYPTSLGSGFSTEVELAIREAFRKQQEVEHKAKENEGRRTLVLEELKVSPNWLTEVFISTRFNDEFWKTHAKPIMDVCRRWGFDAKFIDDAESITDNILDMIRRAHCLIQIIPLLTGDGDLSTVNLSWLHGEYLCATMRPIPTVRAVQLDRNTKAQDWLRILKVNTDQAFLTFANTTELIDRTLPRMLERLRKQLLRP